ncbi:hypothetical protein NBRC116494_01110 [Aurantivibrio plasticivorans]
MGKKITIVIEGRTHVLHVDNPQSLQAIPNDDRQHLLELLGALKTQQTRAAEQAEKALAQAKISGAMGNHQIANKIATKEPRISGDMGKGDVDHIMARLIAEERANQKPSVQPSTIYKWLAGIVVITFILIII